MNKYLDGRLGIYFYVTSTKMTTEVYQNKFEESKVVSLL